MSDMFASYEEEYTSLANSISRKISEIANYSGDRRAQAISSTERDFQNADENLRQMDMELRSVSAAQRATLQAKLTRYQSEIQTLRQQWNKAKGGNNRGDLFDGATSNINMSSTNQRARLLDTTTTMQQTTTRLEESKRTLAETEAVGSAIMVDLRRQRETINHARSGVREIDDNLSRAKRLLSGMARRVTTNKIIMAFIILVLFVIIFLIVYFKWFYHKDSTTPTN